MFPWQHLSLCVHFDREAFFMIIQSVLASSPPPKKKKTKALVHTYARIMFEVLSIGSLSLRMLAQTFIFQKNLFRLPLSTDRIIGHQHIEVLLSIWSPEMRIDLLEKKVKNQWVLLACMHVIRVSNLYRVCIECVTVDPTFISITARRRTGGQPGPTSCIRQVRFVWVSHMQQEHAQEKRNNTL